MAQVDSARIRRLTCSKSAHYTHAQHHYDLMKQILQDLKTGETMVADVACPAVRPGHLLIATNKSLISVGTEKMLVEFGRANLINKARQQPDKVKMVMNKIKTDGLLPTVDAVRNKLDQPLALGYCNVGTVVAIGAGVTEYSVGDRVASNGQHAEIVCVPKNLCAKIPTAVSDVTASFTVVAAIALQGLRLIQPTLGERVVVTGLGLIGLMTVQLLRAQGCKVLGIDTDTHKCELARNFGAEVVALSEQQDPLICAQEFSHNRGVDAVIITASTDSNEPIHQAASMCRKRGRIVLVGVVGLQLSRADFYEKEISFQVSCSYGPGRYDASYEQQGNDYPIGFVRWTEQRNFEAILELMAQAKLSVDNLISHRYDLDDAAEVYAKLGSDQQLGVLLNYPSSDKKLERTVNYVESANIKPSAVSCGFIGAGSYATQVLMPAFSKTVANMVSVASHAGVSGSYAAKKFNFQQATTNSTAMLQSKAINTAVIVTRHNTHADLICQALQNGKHVFVEKPLAINVDQLAQITTAYQDHARVNDVQLMVGFNRRFSPLVTKLKSLCDAVAAPKCFIMTINAGEIAADHWLQDPAVGGGRVIGECCHFVDLMRFLAGAKSSSVQAMKMTETGASLGDKLVFNIAFENGSVGTVHYLANGHKAFPKERLEVFAGGGVIQLDNYRSMKSYGWPGLKHMHLARQDKGNQACVKAFVQSIAQGEEALIPFAELVEVAEICIQINQLIQS